MEKAEAAQGQNKEQLRMELLFFAFAFCLCLFVAADFAEKCEDLFSVVYGIGGIDDHLEHDGVSYLVEVLVLDLRDELGDTELAAVLADPFDDLLALICFRCVRI